MVNTWVIDLCKAGQEKGYRALYEACVPYIYTVVKSYIPDAASHQDVIQDIFAHLFVHLGGYDPDKGPFKPWLRRVAVNHCLMRLRKNDVLDLVVPIDIHADYGSVASQGYEDHRLYDLSKEDIEALLAKMPTGYKTIFLLVAIDEYSHEEVGKMLGIAPETSRSQYFKARKWITSNIMNSTNAAKYGF